MAMRNIDKVDQLIKRWEMYNKLKDGVKSICIM